MKKTFLGFFLILLASNASMAQTEPSLKCVDFFNDDVFVELNLTGFHHFDDNFPTPQLISSGKLNYIWNGINASVTVSSHPAAAWFSEKPTQIGETHQTYSSPKEFPLKGNLQFALPSSSYMKCSCSFYYTSSKSPADPIVCTTLAITEEGDTPFSSSRRVVTPAATSQTKMRNTDISGKIHK